MSYKDIDAGEKIAKVMAGRFVKSKKGTIGLEVMFEFANGEEGKRERLGWVAWFSSTPTKKGLSTLIDDNMETLCNILGYNGSKKVDSNGVILDPNAFDKKKECRITVDLEENPENGKVYPRIKWVNAIGGSGYIGVGADTIASELKDIGFEAAFLMFKNESKQTTKNNSDSYQEEQMESESYDDGTSSFTADDIPF